jgi:hypothetical protein
VWQRGHLGERNYQVPAWITGVKLVSLLLISFSLQSPHRWERAWKSTRPDRGAFVATREPVVISPTAGLPVWVAIDDHRGRVVVVVAGVTTRQGGGSAVTGRRATDEVVQTDVSLEEIDLGIDPQRQLEHLRHLGCHNRDETSSASRMLRQVACPVLRALGGDVHQ